MMPEWLQQKILSRLRRYVPEPLWKILTYVGIVFLLFVVVATIFNTFSEFRRNVSEERVAGDKSTENYPIPITSLAPTPSSGINCYTDWIEFSPDYWENLRSRFVEVNGVYTISQEKKKIDSVAYYIKPCKGGVKADLEFISFGESLINLDFYYGDQFRWEIGGNDLNSVKLYKNENCTPRWNGTKIPIKEEYLPTGEKMHPGQPIRASMLIFLTRGGKLITELNIKYISFKSGEDLSIVGRFYHEFEVGSVCDAKTVPDINLDYNRIGVGLMRSADDDAELPRVKFDRFKISVYPES